MKKINIAIDGPSGVGKSVMSEMIAKKLNYKYISSGSIYRVIAYNAFINNLDTENENLINDAWKFEDIIFVDNNDVFFKNQNVGKVIREDNISKLASKIAKFKSIREKVNLYIQTVAHNEKGVIVDGRDATYRILPNADVKFFLWASPEVRAKRRIKQNIELNIPSNYDEILKSIIERDYADSHRKIDPLKVSEGSIEIDTTNMSIEENFNALYKEIEKGLNNEWRCCNNRKT